MPFFFANRSHVVACFAAGSGFSRGKGVVGGGRVSSTPSVGCEVIGHVVRSWLISAWAQSRAAEAICASVGEGGNGFASEQRRLPRSKV